MRTAGCLRKAKNGVVFYVRTVIKRAELWGGKEGLRIVNNEIMSTKYGRGFRTKDEKRRGGRTKEIALVWCEGPGDGEGRGEVKRVGFWSQVFQSGSPQESKSCVWR